MTEETYPKVGFIGLGVMGEAMCRNLVSAGQWAVTVFDLSAAPVERLVAAGASRASGAEELARSVDVVLLCLPGGDQVCDLVLGEGRLVEILQAGGTLVDMSTSPPALMREVAAAAGARGVDFADAPVARTRQAAADGTLAIMVGAEKEVFARIKPILGTMGSDILHCGGPGAGQTVKIMNNMVLFQTVNALAEAIEIGTASGVDPRVLFEAMSQGSGDSFALRNHGMKSLLPEVYPEQAFSARYAMKDLSYALEMAEEAGVRALGAEVSADRFEAAKEAGYADQYFPVIRRLIGKQEKIS